MQYESDGTVENASNTTNMTRNEIIANLNVLLLAGYDTTSNTLTFCLYELSCNKELQENLRVEINAMLDNCSNNPTFDTMSKLPLLDKCIYETLRKYPLMTVITRECTKQFKVPDSNLVIEKGCQVYLPARAIHWDPEYYPNPHIFDPERFSVEAKSQRNPMSWLPFGNGPRRCLGLRLSKIIMKMTLTVLLTKFEFSLNSKTNNPLIYDPKAFILQEKDGVFLNIRKL